MPHATAVPTEDKAALLAAAGEDCARAQRGELLRERLSLLDPLGDLRGALHGLHKRLLHQRLEQVQLLASGFHGDPLSVGGRDLAEENVPTCGVIACACRDQAPVCVGRNQCAAAGAWPSIFT